MNELAKFFLVPVLKGALIQQVKEAAQGQQPKLEGNITLDCLVLSESPVFQVSDGCHSIDCELSKSAQSTLLQSRRLVGWAELRGLVISLRKYRFNLQSQPSRRCLLHIEETTIAKIEKLPAMGQPRPLDQDNTVVQYIELDQQLADKRKIQDAVDVLPTMENIIEGESAKLPLALNLNVLAEVPFPDIAEADVNDILQRAEANFHPVAPLSAVPQPKPEPEPEPEPKQKQKSKQQQQQANPLKKLSEPRPDTSARTERLGQALGTGFQFQRKRPVTLKRTQPELAREAMPFGGDLSDSNKDMFSAPFCEQHTRGPAKLNQSQDTPSIPPQHLGSVAASSDQPAALLTNSPSTTQDVIGLEQEPEPELKVQKQETKSPLQ